MNNFFDTSLEFAALSIAAVSGSLAIIALLRPIVKRLGGAVAVLQLWWILPLSLVALFLPKVTAGSVWIETAPLVLHSASTTTVAASPANPVPWTMLMLVIWLAGALAMTAWLFANHLRFLQLVTWKPNGRGTTPASTGPAVVGALFPRLALPVDFQLRYSARQRKLILLHETIHRKRRDGLANLLMSVLLVMQWFNPLVFWAVRTLCRDQESACDALIVRRHPTALRDYADAMLKTFPQSSRHLPIVCRWQAFHPTVERIAMLKTHRDLQVKRKWTLTLLLAAVVTSSTLVYALKPATVLLESPTPEAPIATSMSNSPSMSSDAASAIETKAASKPIREQAPVHRVRTLVAQAATPAAVAQEPSSSDGAGHTHYRLDLLITQTIARDTASIEMTTNKSEMSVLVRIGDSMSYDAPSGLRFTLHPKPAEDKISISVQIFDIAKETLVASPRVIAKPNERVSMEIGHVRSTPTKDTRKDSFKIELTIVPLTTEEAAAVRVAQSVASTSQKQVTATNTTNRCEASALTTLQSLTQLFPSGVTAKSFYRDGNNLRVIGLAQTVSQVSALMAAISQSAEFANPDLTSLMRTSDGETTSQEFTITLTHRCQPPSADGAI